MKLKVTHKERAQASSFLCLADVYALTHHGGRCQGWALAAVLISLLTRQAYKQPCQCVCVRKRERSFGRSETVVAIRILGPEDVKF